MPIKDYIRASRYHVEERLNESFYEDYYFKDLIPLKKQVGLSFEIFLCYSPQRKAELIEVNGQHFIIYDQYLGQTFNAINRVVLNSVNVDYGLIHLHKMYSEALLENGCNREALLVASMYYKYKNDSSFIKGDLKLRNNITKSQELYVLAHEAYHLAIIKDPELKNYARDIAVGWLEDQRKTFTSGEYLNLDLIQNSDPIRLHNQDPVEVYSELEKAHSEMRERFDFESLLSNEKFLEEIICDFLATSYTLTVLHLQGIDLNIGARGIHLAHLYKRSLKHVNHSAFYYSSNQLGWGAGHKYENYLQQQIRYQFQRFRCLDAFEDVCIMFNLKLDPSIKKELENQLFEDQKTAYELYYDPAMTLGISLQTGLLIDQLEETIPNLPNGVSPILDVANSTDALKIKSLTYSLLNWPISDLFSDKPLTP